MLEVYKKTVVCSFKYTTLSSGSSIAGLLIKRWWDINIFTNTQKIALLALGTVYFS